jgi:hypothetical protein
MAEIPSRRRLFDHLSCLYTINIISCFIITGHYCIFDQEYIGSLHISVLNLGISQVISWILTVFPRSLFSLILSLQALNQPMGY